MSTRKAPDPIPEEFVSYEEAAEFWDTHDVADYPEALRDVHVTADFKGRRFEIEIEPDVAKTLQAKARQEGVTVKSLASSLLRQQLGT